MWRQDHPSDTQSLRNLIDDSYDDADMVQYFSMDSQEAERHGDTKRFGRNVIWVGMEGALIAVDGNIFDRRKLKAVASAIERGERPTLVVGYGDLHVIEKGDIEEDQAAYDRGELLAARPLDESDIGQFLYQIRDGNHRVFGALLAGEKKVWMHLNANKLQEVTEYRLAKRARKLKAFKEKYGARTTKSMAAIDKKLRND